MLCQYGQNWNEIHYCQFCQYVVCRGKKQHEVAIKWKTWKIKKNLLSECTFKSQHMWFYFLFSIDSKALILNECKWTFFLQRNCNTCLFALSRKLTALFSTSQSAITETLRPSLLVSCSQFRTSQQHSNLSFCHRYMFLNRLCCQYHTIYKVNKVI